MIGILHSLSKPKLTEIRFAVAGERCDRRRDDQRQRCPGAKRHPQLVRDTKHDNDLIEDRNHNGPSSDAKHTREETRQAARGNQYQRQEHQITHDDKLRLPPRLGDAFQAKARSRTVSGSMGSAARVEPACFASANSKTFVRRHT
jgi:hypothetical protein